MLIYPNLPPTLSLPLRDLLSCASYPYCDSLTIWPLALCLLFTRLCPPENPSRLSGSTTQVVLPISCTKMYLRYCTEYLSGWPHVVLIIRIQRKYYSIHLKHAEKSVQRAEANCQRSHSLEVMGINLESQCPSEPKSHKISSAPGFPLSMTSLITDNTKSVLGSAQWASWHCLSPQSGS